MTFTILMFSILLFFVIFDLFSRKKMNKKLKEMIAGSWAEIPGETLTERDVSSISSYYTNRRTHCSSGIDIDDITWNDLEMNKIFHRINNTLSTVGEEYLYNLLRHPASESELRERRRLCNLFQKEETLRGKLQFLLARLGKTRCLDITDYLYGNEARYKNKLLYYLLAGVLLFSTAFMVLVNIKIGAAALALSLITNATVYYRIKNTFEYRFMPLSYIIQMIGTANKLMKLEIPELQAYRTKLSRALGKAGKIGRKGFGLLTKAQNPITEYVKSLLFAELIVFENCHNWVIEYRDEIKEIYETLGYLDSMISAASFKECLDICCEPEFISDPEGRIRINSVDIYHPLISEPATNTYSFDQPVLITGSNASGKSTFLKSVAINAILAQTIATCTAREFQMSRCSIYTSMALKDNLENRESYFVVELKSLKRIIDAVNSGIPCLCIVDEVLRGTNTVERIAASSEVLASLGNKKCICLAATHDIELASILEGIYENHHFREEVTQDNHIMFDYILYPGVSDTMNALKLLKIMGYDSRIVNKARARSDKFLREGVWEKVSSLEGRKS